MEGMNKPKILVFAGPNGSGKSAVTNSEQIVGFYVNADEIEKARDCTPLEAAKIAEATRGYFVDHMLSFTMETVLSTTRNIDLLARARSLGFEITCIYVTTNNPAINVARAKLRLQNTKHGVGMEKGKVDEQKIIDRYHRAMKLIPQLCEVCDRLLVYDNSLDRDIGKPSLIAEIQDGKVSVYPSSIWTESAIKSFLSGEYMPDSVCCPS